MFSDIDGFNTLLHTMSARSKAEKENETALAGGYCAAKQHIREKSTHSVGKHHKSNRDVRHGDSARAHCKTVYTHVSLNFDEKII